VVATTFCGIDNLEVLMNSSTIGMVIVKIVDGGLYFIFSSYFILLFFFFFFLSFYF